MSKPANNLDLSLIPTPKEDAASKKASKPSDERYLALQKRAQERIAEVHERAISAIESRSLQSSFPFWDDSNRGVPNPLIRSGLFSVQTSEKREFIQDLVMPSLANYSITYSGLSLQQDDLSTWLALINMARNQPMSDAIYFTGYSIVKDLGWRMHSESYQRVQDSIERLKVTGIKITTANKNQGYSGSLIRDYSWTEKDEAGRARWMVRFEPKVSILFMKDTTTLLEWETRKKIGTRASTALWLHAYWSSHAEPIPISVQKIHELCRSNDSLASFKTTIKRALDKLIEVGFLVKYEVNKEGTIRIYKKIRPKLVSANS